MKRFSILVFAFAVCAFANAQVLTLKGTPVSELTSQYVEVYVIERMMSLREFEVVVDAGQIVDFNGILERKGGTDGLLLRPDGTPEQFNGPVAILNYLHEYGGYKAVDMSISIGQQGRYKHYLLEKQND